MEGEFYQGIGIYKKGSKRFLEIKNIVIISRCLRDNGREVQGI